VEVATSGTCGSLLFSSSAAEGLAGNGRKFIHYF
jgi:hypothetical protein